MRRYEKGESSRKTPLSSTDENERPFKKAKYVWQLKGKYHLKEQYKYTNSDESSSRNIPNQERPETKEEKLQSNCDESSTKNCSRCLSTLLAHSNTLLENEDLSDHEDNLSNMDQSIYDDIPVSMVRPRRENHDDFLQKWQARQVAKSFIDNTINTILEQWKLAPADATEFVENCDNGQVEDEGIMMAIQSHGLQSSAQRFPMSANFKSTEPANSSSIPIGNNYLQESTENYQNRRFEHSDGGNTNTESAGGRLTNGIEADQMDFLSTAVTMAIQNKGLSSYSYG